MFFSGSTIISSMELDRLDGPLAKPFKKIMWSSRLSPYIVTSFKHVPTWGSALHRSSMRTMGCHSSILASIVTRCFLPLKRCRVTSGRNMDKFRKSVVLCSPTHAWVAIGAFGPLNVYSNIWRPPGLKLMGVIIGSHSIMSLLMSPRMFRLIVISYVFNDSLHVLCRVRSMKTSYHCGGNGKRSEGRTSGISGDNMDFLSILTLLSPKLSNMRWPKPPAIWCVKIRRLQTGWKYGFARWQMQFRTFGMIQLCGLSSNGVAWTCIRSSMVLTTLMWLNKSSWPFWRSPRPILCGSCLAIGKQCVTGKRPLLNQFCRYSRPNRAVADMTANKFRTTWISKVRCFNSGVGERFLKKPARKAYRSSKVKMAPLRCTFSISSRGGGALAIADLIFMKYGNSILGLRQSTWCSYRWTQQSMRRSGTWTPGTAGTWFCPSRRLGHSAWAWEDLPVRLGPLHVTSNYLTGKDLVRFGRQKGHGASRPCLVENFGSCRQAAGWCYINWEPKLKLSFVVVGLWKSIRAVLPIRQRPACGALPFIGKWSCRSLKPMSCRSNNGGLVLPRPSRPLSGRLAYHTLVHSFEHVSSLEWHIPKRCWEGRAMMALSRQQPQRNTLRGCVEL